MMACPALGFGLARTYRPVGGKGSATPEQLYVVSVTDPGLPYAC